MITPGQASRIACWISLLTSTSHDGRWPLFGSCWRRWMCMTLAPALNAALASRAICSGVTGTLCCLGSVSTPFSAQVMTALSPMDQPSGCETRGVGIADILRKMRKVNVLVGEMQQMPGALPGAERSEGDSGLFLEQMQEAR